VYLFSKKNKLLIEIIIALLAFSFLFLLLAKVFPSAYFLSKPINLYDEGILLTGAKRIAHGGIPYKDFWAIYPPLNYITLSVFFKFFGDSVLVERMHNIFFALMALLSLYWLFRTKIGWSMSAIAVLTFLFFSSPLKSTHLFIFLILISLFTLIKSKKNRFIPYILGACLGLLFVSRLDFGLLLGLITFITTIVLCKPDYKKIIYLDLKIFVGFLLAILPIFAWLALNSALVPFLEQVIVYPFFGNFVAQRNLPMPSLIHPEFGFAGSISFAFEWLFPIIVSIVFFLVLFLKNLRKSRFQLSVFGLLAIGSFPYMLQRSDMPHLTFVNVLGLAFIFYVIFSIKKFNLKYFLIGLVVSLLLVYYPIRGRLKLFDGVVAPMRVYSFYSELLPQTDDNLALESMLNYIKNNVASSEPIYVGLSDHSKVFINNVFLYFVLPNKIPTMYHELHPGVVDTKKVQEKIINEIKHVKYVVLWDYFYCEPNESCVSTEVHLLDDYIKNNYSAVKTFGKYTLLTLK